jgi:ribonucleoside-diphosphate reductase alpha chain
MSWSAVEEYLVRTRYSALDPATGEPLESDYAQMLTVRLLPALRMAAQAAGLASKNRLEMVIDRICDALASREVILATPALMSLGNAHTRRPGYFSCFPLGHVSDSLEGIEEMHHKMRKIYIAGGGVGIDLSLLRPKGSLVDNGQGAASGPVGFLADFDAVTGTTNQGGRRRGALLVQLDWNHPDIREFVKVKNFNHTLNKLIQTLPPEERPARGLSLSNMNISVNVFGDFWEDEELVSLIAENMWKTGDPGLLFIDNMVKYSPMPAAMEPKFSNPCGEYLAPADTACNLVTVNAAKLARDTLYERGGQNEFFQKMSEAGALACHLGNIILTLDEGYPLESIREKTQRLRPVGVGMSGFHTALLLMTKDCEYGDKKAVRFAKRTQAALTAGTLKESIDIQFGRETKGAPFGADYYQRHWHELEGALMGTGVSPPLSTSTTRHSWEDDCGADVDVCRAFYNCVTTSQAPTGSTSIFLRNLDTGIEPFYALEVSRRVEDKEEGWKTYTLKPNWLPEDDPELWERAEAQTALKLTPEAQLNMLGAFQKYVHTGVSKTVNLPASATVEDIRRLIFQARDMRLKGFTVYRDSSLDNVISVGAPKAAPEPPKEPAKPAPADDLPEVRAAHVYTAKSANLSAHITLAHDAERRVREVFVAAGGPGADINGIFTAFGMILSVALRKAPQLFDSLVKVLCKVRMDQRVRIRTGNSESPVVGTSLPQAIGMLMREHQDYLLTGKGPEGPSPAQGGCDLCPECHELALRRSGSCMKCANCGYSSC